MNALIHGALRNRLLVVLLFAIACGAGVFRLLQLPVDAFPDTTPVQVQINTVAPALSTCLLYTSPSSRDRQKSRMPSSA